jgi:hypothetical protein
MAVRSMVAWRRYCHFSNVPVRDEQKMTERIPFCRSLLYVQREFFSADGMCDEGSGQKQEGQRLSG